MRDINCYLSWNHETYEELNIFYNILCSRLLLHFWFNGSKTYICLKFSFKKSRYFRLR